MKQTFTFFLFLICPYFIFANKNIQLVELRNHFYAASEEKIDLDSFASFIDQINAPDNPTVKAYQAMLFMLKAKDSWNPFNKFKYFNQGKDLLEKLILENQNNVELRFLRLCIQINLPSFLNYNQIEKDTDYLLQNKTEDEDLRKRVNLLLIENQLQISKK